MSRSRRFGRTHLFPIALLILLTWGALAVGGWPSWAGVPVAVFAVATGVIGVIEAYPTITGLGDRHERQVMFALMLVVGAIGLQLVPLPKPAVTMLSPSRDSIDHERLLAMADRRDPDTVAVVPPRAPRPLSIAPSRTWIGAGFLAAFACLLVGSSRGFSAAGVKVVSRGILVLGVVVALLGLRQLTTDSYLLYGLYVPLVPPRLSAPFVNHNHQAGWLVMVASLAAGSFVGELTSGSRTVPSNWRDRLLWLSSKQANLALLFLFAFVLIATDILATRSRSGAAAFVLAMSVLVSWYRRQQTAVRPRRAVLIGLTAMLLIAMAAAGSGVAARILHETSWSTLDGRIGVWKDSLGILRDYWRAGTGFNTYGVAMLQYQTVRDGSRYIEAHNDYLQLAVEGGLLIGIPALILVVSLARTAIFRLESHGDDTRTYWLRVGAIVGVMAIAAQSTFDFTLQVPGASAMFVVLAAIAVHQPRLQHEVRRSDASAVRTVNYGY